MYAFFSPVITVLKAERSAPVILMMGLHRISRLCSVSCNSKEI